MTSPSLSAALMDSWLVKSTGMPWTITLSTKTFWALRLIATGQWFAWTSALIWVAP